MTRLPKPLPCPFCGTLPINNDSEAEGKATLACVNDYCFAQPDVNGKNQRQAVERWNKRDV